MEQVLVKKDEEVKENSSDLRKRRIDMREGERSGENKMPVSLLVLLSWG